jgi:hypothetical protein
MKQKDLVTMRGTMSARAGADHPTKIQLFDGRFDTGYKITRFKIMPYDVDNTNVRNIAAKLSISPNVDTAQSFDFNDNREIGWSYFGFDANGFLTIGEEVIDRDNIIIEDLWIFGWEIAAGTSSLFNYYIEAERVELTDAMGAVTMARNTASRSGQTWTP